MNTELEINIPTDWSEISIQKYQMYVDSVNDITEERDIIAKTISILCDIPEAIIYKIKLKDLKVIHSKLQKLISRPVNKEIINKINIDDKVFGWHSKLDDITMGEFVDIEQYAKDNNLAGMMSVLYRPIIKEDGNRYDIEPYDALTHEKNVALFKKLSVNIANPVAVFFWNLGSIQLANFHQSLKEVEANQVQQASTDGSLS